MSDEQAFIQGRPRRLAVWLLIAGAMLHLALAAATDLSPDEAHYALYGAHLDWSYFDHPALVGWLQAPFVAAGGTNIDMRVVPMVSWLAAAALLCVLCRSLSRASSGEEAPNGGQDDLWVVALLFLSPLLNLLGVALVPDTLLMPLVPAAMMATWRLRSDESLSDWRRWVVLALILGLALLAKYTGLFLALGALTTLLAFHGRSLLRVRGAWLAFAMIVLATSPIFYWNARHDWSSFAYQSAHAEGGQPWRLIPLVRAGALQFLLFGLLLPMAAMRACRRTAGQTATGEEARRDVRRLCLLFAMPVLLVFLALAGRGSSLPHWTACGWIALVPLAVVGVRELRRGLLVGAILWQTGLIGIIVVLIATGGPFSEAGAAARSLAGIRTADARANPVADLLGWPAAAAHGSALAARYGARGLVVMNWSLASRLAWYGRPMPVFVAPPRLNQFQLWFGSLRRGDSAIAIDWSGMPLPIPVGPNGFSRCSPIDQLATVQHGKQLAHFNFLLCHDWLGPMGSAPD